VATGKTIEGAKKFVNNATTLVKLLIQKIFYVIDVVALNAPLALIMSSILMV
jgi:hypothetical protein